MALMDPGSMSNPPKIESQCYSCLQWLPHLSMVCVIHLSPCDGCTRSRVPLPQWQGICGSLSWSLVSSLTLFWRILRVGTLLKLWASMLESPFLINHAQSSDWVSWLLFPAYLWLVRINFLITCAWKNFKVQGTLPIHYCLLRPRGVLGTQYLLNQDLSNGWTLVMLQIGPLVSSLELCVLVV